MRKKIEYMADFETRASEQARLEGVTWVYAWALCPISDYEQVTTGSHIGTFLATLRRLGGGKVYFHNLAFDGVFILYHLLENGYTYIDGDAGDGICQTVELDDMPPKSVTAVISDTGVFYQIIVKESSRVTINFVDSLKKLPFSVDKIAKGWKTKHRKATRDDGTEIHYDYALERAPGCVLDADERKYLENDVKVVAEALSMLEAMGMTRMTIGSDCLAEYKATLGGEDAFRAIFPELPREIDTYCRKAYRGGWVYTSPKHARKTIYANGHTYDVNSLYPSMMSSTPYTLGGIEYVNRYPVGVPEYYTGSYADDPEMPIYIQRIRVALHLREGYLPTVQLRNTPGYIDKEYVITIPTEMPEELTLTSVDLEMLLEHYEIDYIEMIDGYKFRAAEGVFDTYINKWMAIKIQATKDGNAPLRQLSKLMLNNLYGKMAQSIDTINKVPVLEGGKIKWMQKPGLPREGVYLAAGAFVTAYARRFTISGAQENYNNFVYSDTDSLHLLDDGNPPAGLWVTEGGELCGWKPEVAWDAIRAVRAKTYMEHAYLEDGNTSDRWIIKCAGMPDAVKAEFAAGMAAGEYEPDAFDFGWQSSPVLANSRKKKLVRGGVLIYPGVFQIKEK